MESGDTGKPELNHRGKESRDSETKSSSLNREVTTRKKIRVLKKKEGNGGQNGGGSPVGKKQRRNVSPERSFVPEIKRKRNSLSAVRVEPDGPKCSVGKQEEASTDNSDDDDIPLALSRRKRRERQVLSIVNVKQPEGLVCKKRAKNSVSQKEKPLRKSGGNGSKEARDVVELGNVSGPADPSGNKRKRESIELKEKRVRGDRSDTPLKNKDTGYSDQGTSTKLRRKKIYSVLNQTHLFSEASKPECSYEKLYGDVEEDDADSIEKSAAKTLCCMADQSSTRPSSKIIASSARPSNESFIPQSGHLERSQKEASESDDEPQVSHPRRRNGKNLSRKRRHFYEVCARDLNPFFLVKQKIKVFWPLDNAWYAGIVKEYDPVRRKHYIIYDDEDEEWAHLPKDRIKVLLLPSEVAPRTNRKKPRSVFKPKNESKETEVIDDNNTECSVESEPIITWLSRSVHRAKSSTANIAKKQSDFNSSRVSAFFTPKKPMVQCSPSAKRDKSLSTDTDEECSGLNECEEVLLDEHDSTDRRLPFVYSRGRLRKTNEGYLSFLERDYCAESTEGSIEVLASAVDRASTEEHRTTVESRRVKLRLSLPLLSIRKFLSEGSNFWFCRILFLLQHGKLMCLWPMVHLEVVLVDNGLGLKHFSSEICLISAVSIFCSLVGTLNQFTRQWSLKKLNMPFTTIRFKISGLHGKSQVVLVLFSFLGMEKSNWKRVEEKILACLVKTELSRAECTYSNILELKNRKGQRISTSVDLFLPEGFSGNSDDLMHQLFQQESICPGVNPFTYLDELRITRHRSDFHMTAAPSLLLAWHLKLVVENNLASDHLQRSMSSTSGEAERNDHIRSVDVISIEDSLNQDLGNTPAVVHYSSGPASVISGVHPFSHVENAPSDAHAATNTASLLKSPSKKVTVTESTVSSRNVNSNVYGVINFQRSPSENGLCESAEEPSCSRPQDLRSSRKSKDRCDSCINSSKDQKFDRPGGHLVNETEKSPLPVTNLIKEMNAHAIGHATPTAPRSTWRRNRFTSISRAFGNGSRFCPEDFVLAGFASGSKKPRTQISYSTSPKGDVGAKQQSNNRKVQSSNNVKANNLKRLPGNSNNPQICIDSLTCDANVLVMGSDRGWRECGVQVLLDSIDQSEWRISVNVSGTTKYTHKVHHLLQPGVTNRFTHAMMWKGGIDWSLEFTDRSQWSLFKQIYEECYNHNARAASIKNIPTPGVRLVVNAHNDYAEVPFRRSTKYLQQVGSDIDLALDESRVLYDMDSDDDEWFLGLRKSLENCSYICEITEDLFELLMDRFEKLAYTHNCEEFTTDQIQEFIADVGPMEIIKMIHDYWRLKRQKNGMPLVRYLQPALWKVYQKQLQEWEANVTRIQSSSEGCQGKSLPNKPPMFAFCLRPRGLAVSYKGLKHHRSHKKLMFSGYHSVFSKEQDGFNRFGRKSNELLPVPVGKSYEPYDGVGWLRSSSGISPKSTLRIESSPVPVDVVVSERCLTPKFYKTHVKKTGTLSSFEDRQTSPSFCHQSLKRSRNDNWNSEAYEWVNPKPFHPASYQNHRVDVEELKLRDASSAAQHAAAMAKLKKEKAQLLACKADLALHKAATALMIADAIKDSERDILWDG